MTYEVWYRAGQSLHWWKLPAEYATKLLALYVRDAVEAALKQVGYADPQVEVRLVQQEYASESEAIIGGF